MLSGDSILGATKMANLRLLGLCQLLLLVLQPMSASETKTPRKQWNHRILFSQLVALGVGWVVLEDGSGNNSPMRLYWTEDNGCHWRNITPPNMVTRHISDVFFLDRAHGWFLSSDALSEEGDASFYVFSTQDAGRSWRSVVLHRPTFGISDDYTFPTELFFSDSQHGWMLWHWHMMNSSVNYLLSTGDGGRTWNRLPDARGAGPIQFTTPYDGWAIGTSPEDIGIPTPGNDALFVTHDGGKHWTEVRVPLPDNIDASSAYFYSLRFKNERVGSVLLSEQFNDGRLVSVVYVTRDGGKTWRSSASNGAPQSFSLLDSGPIRSYYDPDDHSYGSLHIQSGKRTISPKMPDDVLLAPGYSFPVFLNHSNAWMSTGSALLATTDSGKSFRLILPSPGAPEWFPIPRVGAVNGIGAGLSIDEKNLQPVVAGDVTVLQGRGFLEQNTISIDEKPFGARSDDGETIRFTAPRDLTAGAHLIRVENAHGKSDSVEIAVCGVGRPRILEVHTGVVDVSGSIVAHRGKFFTVSGCGFLAENRVSFEGQAEVTGMPLLGQNLLRVDVPASLVPGIYRLYVTNENGSSDSVTIIVD